MSKAQELAKKCQAAVFNQVEQDRGLNAENITLAIQKEIAVERDDSPQRKLDLGDVTATVAIVTRAQDLLSEVSNFANSPKMAGLVPPSMAAAHINLRIAISKAGF